MTTGHETIDECRAMYSKMARAMVDAGKLEEAAKYQDEARFWFWARLAALGMESELSAKWPTRYAA
jgi:hypothetical protein